MNIVRISSLLLQKWVIAVNTVKVSFIIRMNYPIMNFWNNQTVLRWNFRCSYENIIVGQKQENTAKKTKYDVNVFFKFLGEVGETRVIINIPCVQLDKLFCNFDISVRRRDKTRAERGWAVKRAVRSSCNVWCGVGLARALLPRFRCVFKPAKFSFQQTGNLIFFL